MPKLKIPRIDDILNESLNEVLSELSVNSLVEALEKITFSELVNIIEEKAHQLYKKYELNAIKEYLEKRGMIKPMLPFDVIKRVIDNSLIVSLANIRRARAGLTSQKLLVVLLRALGIPCEISKIKTRSGYCPDIAIPSDAILLNNPRQGFALAVKRTLRERWSEDISIFSEFPNAAFVLIKPDPDFNQEKAENMVRRGMKKIYIPDELYENVVSAISDKKIRSCFRKLSDLPRDLKDFINKYPSLLQFL